MMEINTLARRSGKVTMNIEKAKLYIEQGKRVVFMTLDQRETISMLARHFPKALFELVGKTGVRIHKITIAPLCIGCHENRSNPPSELCTWCQP